MSQIRVGTNMVIKVGSRIIHRVKVLSRNGSKIQVINTRTLDTLDMHRDQKIIMKYAKWVDEKSLSKS